MLESDKIPFGSLEQNRYFFTTLGQLCLKNRYTEMVREGRKGRYNAIIIYDGAKPCDKRKKLLMYFEDAEMIREALPQEVISTLHSEEEIAQFVKMCEDLDDMLWQLSLGCAKLLNTSVGKEIKTSGNNGLSELFLKEVGKRYCEERQVKTSLRFLKSVQDTYELVFANFPSEVKPSFMQSGYEENRESKEVME